MSIKLLISFESFLSLMKEYFEGEPVVRPCFYTLTYEFRNASFVCGNGIVGSGDGSAHNDIVRADLFCLGGSHNSLLVADVTVCKANTGSYGEEFFSATLVDLACLKR
jgi:hypothetical protein